MCMMVFTFTRAAVLQVNLQSAIGCFIGYQLPSLLDLGTSPANSALPRYPVQAMTSANAQTATLD